MGVRQGGYCISTPDHAGLRATTLRVPFTPDTPRAPLRPSAQQPAPFPPSGAQPPQGLLRKKKSMRWAVKRAPERTWPESLNTTPVLILWRTDLRSALSLLCPWVSWEGHRSGRAGDVRMQHEPRSSTPKRGPVPTEVRKHHGVQHARERPHRSVSLPPLRSVISVD